MASGCQGRQIFLPCNKVTEKQENWGYTMVKQRKELTTMAKNINNQEFQNLIQGDQPVLVDYWAPWCGYCRRIGPAYDRIAEQFAGEVEVVKINIDDEPLLARDEHIEVIPTLVLYRGGEALDSIVAPESKAMIEAFIHNALAQ